MPQKMTDERAIDEWFHRRGIPLMLDTPGRNARVAQRMTGPLAVGWFGPWVVDAFTEPDWATAVGLAVSVAAVVLLWAAGNLSRRRAPFALPPRVGVLEVVGFVVLPPLAVLLSEWVKDRSELDLGGEFAGVALLVTYVGFVIVQIVVLLVAWAVVRSGLVSLARFLLREFSNAASVVGVAVARTLPVMLGVVTFFFLTAEVWQSVGSIGTPAYITALLLFLVVAGYFLGSRFQLDLDALARFESRAEIESAVAGTSIGSRLTVPDAGKPLTVALDRSERLQLRLIAALSKLVVASVVASAVFAFFLLLGVLVVDAATVEAWTTAPPRVIREFDLGGVRLAMTWQHVRVAGFLAVFSGFYYSVVSATDAKLREGVRDTATDAVRQACAVKLCLETPLTGCDRTPAVP
ncbi:hypothetical protein [Actinokineospora sp. HUAS TT18]|uniref:hypothetical protein n=1 Tax=Actinokineospora sp. HUAS TT18 TaxID=3447451 RepID=UPI003F51F544